MVSRWKLCSWNVLQFLNFFCIDGVSFCTSRGIILQVIIIRLQPVSATNVEHTEAPCFSFGKVPETFIWMLFRSFHQFSSPWLWGPCWFVLHYDLVLIWFVSFSKIATCTIFVIFVAWSLQMGIRWDSCFGRTFICSTSSANIVHWVCTCTW